jgi:ABC-type nitrate/sulfonate/bicarbonate transport system substrate-binding protein
MPRVYQQIDWSNGGIVCRSTIKSVGDMRGKTVVLAQNSPSHFFLLNTLIAGGLQPSEVSASSRRTPSSRTAFSTDKSLSCAVAGRRHL